ncbi:MULTISPECIES: FAD:protein FMN transferase [Clostridium]|uniref:FAD:protein FMN transferase n=1 Tax=Clostridium TaxID=1485 RepID=UPI0009839D42|nr:MULTISPECIES: FAD:protein FMN transferase [Clostridium]AQR94912.1 thiamine biosynthesis lipoprotein ApbE precursor [Clostridium saccharoperbutylacetonicum]NSB30754.1 thiamine biosynthesis lipoprotein [Clostridium saccharoperbutylacetonicum]
MKKFVYVLMACVFVVSSFSACGNSKNKYYEKSNIVMDTAVTLSAFGPNAKEAVDESFKRLDEIEKMASTTIETSDIYKINNFSGKAYVKVHPEILKMVKTAVQYSKLSNGAFDITTGPIINLWGIGTDNERLPSVEEIKAKLPLVGYERISINEAESSIMLKDAGMAIDLGGVAKGFATDEVLKIYKKYNIENGLINLGTSSLYAVGKNKENKDWSVGIKHPRSDDSNAFLGVVKISNEALSTSGDYERYFIKDNKRYHHIMDPKTGYPVDNGVVSDTIVINGDIEDNGMIADILTTTVFSLGAEKGIELLDSMPQVSGEITTSENKIYTSQNFKERITDLNKDFKYAN